jgi:crossover junction endodeoxyribonuclease RusA
MNKNVILVLPYPVSANRYWATRVVTPKGGRAMAMTYVTPEAKEYQKQVLAAARALGVVAPIVGRVQIDIRLYPHRPLDFAARQRKHGAAWSDTVQCLDLDNTTKVLLDALKGVAMEDDKWVRRIISERMDPDEHGARVVVRVLALEVEQPQLGLAIEEATA